MPFFIIRQDITCMQVDVIVTAAGARAVPDTTGGVNGRIHRKAGPQLLEAIRRLGGVRTGCAEITPAFELPCKYVIHTAGPVWRDGLHGEKLLLRSCYRESLALAHRRGLTSIAFPLISTGRYGYPKQEAVQVASRTIREFLDRGVEMTVYLVVYDEEAFRVSSELFDRVEQFIDAHYVQAHPACRNQPGETGSAPALQERMQRDRAARAAEDAPPPPPPAQRAPAPPAAPPPPSAAPKRGLFQKILRRDAAPTAAPPPLIPHKAAPAAAAPPPPKSLDQMLRHLDASFSETLLHLIDEKGMKDSECYKKANVDKKVFSKIHNNPGYTPKKTTVVAFAIALELDMDATRDLLSRAGYGMSHASVFDIIIEFFISNAYYDVDRINQVLYDHDMPLLGSNMA